MPAPLGRRILVVVLAVLAVSFGVTSTVLIAQNAGALRRQVEAEATAVSRAVEATIRTVMVNGRGDLAAEVVEKLREVPGLDRVQMYRTSGVEAFRDLRTLDDVTARLRARDQADRAAELARHLRESGRDLKTPPARSGDPAIAQAAATGRLVVRDEQTGDGSALTYFLPLRNDRICQECHGRDHAVRGVLVVSVDTSHLQGGLLRSSALMAGSLALTAVLIGAGLLWSLRRVVLRPIDALVANLRSDDPGRALDRMPPKTALELTTLAAALDDSVSRVKTAQAAVVRSEKLAGLGRLAGGIAHDFNNLLMVVSGYSQLLARHLASDERGRRYASVVEDAAERGAQLVRQLLAFSRRQPAAPTVLDLNQVVSGFEALLRRLIGETIELTIVAAAQRARVRADPAQVEQIVMNLVVNARDAMPDGGAITVETGDVELAAGPHVLLTVTDNGCGMDEATRAKIFEPFFTTKEPGRGTGLGLATVYGIVQQHGGAVDVESAPARGTTFRIWLPTVTDAPTPVAPAPRTVVTGGCETILLAEDDDAVRTLELTVLAAAGYAVLEARDGREALDVAERHAGAIDLLLTDVVMPRMNGVELAARLRARRPDVRVVYVSGYTDVDIPAEDALMIRKPIAPDTLAVRIREALAEPRDALAEPRDALAEPRDALAEPRDALAEPRDARGEPCAR